MKYFLRGKKQSKILATILACIMLVTTIGANSIVVRAAISASMFTKETGTSVFEGENITIQDGENGVEVIDASTENANLASHTITTTSTYNVYDKGLHLEVTDIKGRDTVGSGDTIASGYQDDYTFLVHIGANTHSWYSSLNYADTCLVMAIGSNGCYKIWYNKTSGNNFSANPTFNDAHIISYGVLNEGYTPADKGHALSLDVKVEEGNYFIVVNGQIISFADNGWLTQSQLQAAKVGLHVWAPMDSTTYACVYDGNQNPFNVNYTPAGSSYVITDLSETASMKPYVTLNPSSINMEIGEEETLTATMYPTTAKVKSWVSDNEEVATVADGVVTAKAEGTATITATADNGTTATCKVNVYEDVPAGVVDESYLEIKNGGGVTLNEVSTGVQVEYDATQYNTYVSTTHRYSLERGVLYRITDIKKMDATSNDGYSIAMSIGNNANGQQWYDKDGYIILYGKSGNFAILKTLGNGLWATGDGTTGYEKVAATKLDSLDDELSIYVKEVGSDWQVIVNDQHAYTLSGATEYLGGVGARQWFSVGAMSDFDATSSESNPTSGLSWYGVTNTTNTKCGLSFTVSNIAPTVPTVFTDGMLFQQEKAMNVWGYGIPAQTVNANLYKGEELLETKTATVTGTGRWDVSFDSREGSYDNYKIELSVGNNIQHVINDVLVGELWVSGGQSNMEWEVENDWNKETLLAQTEDANSEYLRVFLEPSYPLGVESGRKYPAIDIPNAYWGYGNEKADIGAMSSVAYTFAKELQEKLDMPIGIVNTSIGGTCIEGWLSREAIESEPELVEKLSQKDNDKNEEAYLSSSQMYYPIEEWDTVTSGGTSAVGETQAYVMTSLYNQKIGPLEGMNVAGTIWWQGSSNITSSEYYDEELDLLKRCWGETFGYGNEDMPFIFTQVTPYEQGYGSYMEYSVLGYLAEAMEQAWKLNKDNKTAMLTVYDQPLDFIWKEYGTEAIPDDMVNRLHPVHTRNKGGIGERFALSAWNMVYDGTEEYTAPVYESMSIEENAIYITFERVGNGLKTIDGTTNVHGFTIAGKDGVYVNAEAEIVGLNKVKVWNEFVSKPTNVMYGFSDLNQGSNLCSSVGIPAAPFRTVVVDDNVKNQDPNTTLFVAQDWMYADKDVWVYHGGIAKADSLLYQAYVQAGYQTNADKLADAHYNFDDYPSFAVAGGASTYSYDSAVKAEGTASLKVEYDSDFTVSPILTYQSVKMLDWSKFDYLSVSVRNAADVNVVMTIDGVTIPTLDGATSAQHSGSEEFKVITFDLSEVSETDRANFSEVEEMTFSVTGDGAGTMYFDKFMVGRNTVAGVELEKESLLMIPGETEVLATTLSTSGTVTWSSENEAVATVDSTGLITAVATGRTTITATVGEYEATCDVWVCTKPDANHMDSNHVYPISNDDKHKVQECINGYKVDYQIGAADWHRMNFQKNLPIDSTAGTRIEIDNIETKAEKYSIGVWFGKSNTGWNTVDGYMLLCKNNGEFVVVESKASTGVDGSGVLAQGDIGMECNALSIDIQYDTDGKTLNIKVNGVTCSFKSTKTISKFAVGAMGDFSVNGETNILSYTSLDLASSPLQYIITYLGWSGDIGSVIENKDYTTVYNYCKAKNVAPEKGGFIFAGWYSDSEATKKVDANVKEAASGTSYYAKFVPKEVLNVRAQFGLTETSGKRDLRLVTTVDKAYKDYQKVGFVVTNALGVSKSYESTTAYSSLKAGGVQFVASDFNNVSKRFITKKLTGVNVVDNPGREMILQAYWVTHDGVTVYGTARRVTIQQGLDAIKNSTNVVNE